jgi:UDP-2,3-diacylglucosamine pyrophosphatase LpxH
VIDLAKLYAVSDLHMGGPSGKWAFREGDVLGWLIAHIDQTDPNEQVGLLLNGDVFDFLAEPGAQEFSYNADGLLRRILGNPHLVPVVSALRKLVANPKRLLIVAIGNHDIELALPDVQEAFLQVIGASRDDRRARVLFPQDPEGWLCKVAGKLVLAVHGNQSDPWNVVDYPGLQAAARRNPAEGGPRTNAGTTMVLRVINTIKQTYPFVDLLKPEGAPLMAILQAVDAPTSSRGLAGALGQLSIQRGTASEILGDTGMPELAGDRESDIDSYLASLPRPTSEDMLLQAESQLFENKEPLRLIEDRGGKLGQGVDFIRSRWALRSQSGQDRKVSLRNALASWLRDDQSFELGFMSRIDRRIVQAATRGIEVLLAGHTHLARALGYKGCVYINTGTWMRVLKLQGSPYLQTDTDFDKLWTALQAGSLAAIDRLEGLDPRLRPVAIIDLTGARLMSVTGQTGNFGFLELYPGGLES